MTESEWLACDDPDRMLCFLRGERPPAAGLFAWLGLGPKSSAPVPPWATDRKLLLYACACCRRLPELYRDERSLQAIDAAEALADGMISKDKVREADSAAREALDELMLRWDPGRDRSGLMFVASGGWAQPWLQAAWAAAEVVRGAPEAAVQAMVRAATAVATDWGDPRRAATALGAAARVALLRDLFNNPFRPPRLDPAWLTWQEGAVRKLAEGIYEERAFDRLPVLADALEEAGCTDADILDHGRGGAEHVRGCWVVDLLTHQA